MNRIINLLLISFIIAGFLTGCASQGANILRYDQNQRASKPDGYQIEILDRETIDRPFRVIAEVSDRMATVYDTEEQVISNFFQAARQIGGDAIIDLETDTRNESHDWIPKNVKYFKAKVIVFTD